MIQIEIYEKCSFFHLQKAKTIDAPIFEKKGSMHLVFPHARGKRLTENQFDMAS